MCEFTLWFTNKNEKRARAFSIGQDMIEKYLFNYAFFENFFGFSLVKQKVLSISEIKLTREIFANTNIFPLKKRVVGVTLLLFFFFFDR